MQLNYIEINGNLEEVTCHGTPGFPMEVYLDVLDLYPNRSISWHWHKEAELIYVLEGQIELYAGSGSYLIGPGQGGMVPASLLHQIYPYQMMRGSEYCAILADPYLFHGLPGGVVEGNYASALWNARKDFFLLDGAADWHREPLSCIRRMYACDCERPVGYQWELQILLQRTGLALLRNLSSVPERESPVSDLCYQRVKSAMEFIHREYPHKIYLEDIAKAACVSRSECCRDFQKVIRQSPGEYLNAYRIRMGEYQLAHTEKSVLDIALSIGFSSSSHFSHVFTEAMGCTPLKYRKKERQTPGGGCTSNAAL